MVYGTSTAADQQLLTQLGRKAPLASAGDIFYIARDGRIAAECLFSPSYSERHSARRQVPSVLNAPDQSDQRSEADEGGGDA
jgi:hypothetical protein